VCKINEYCESTQEESLKQDYRTTGLEIAGEGKEAMHDVNKMEFNVMDDESLNEKG